MIKRILGGYMPAFKDHNGKIVQNSVSCIEKIRVGGVEQGITMRGKSDNLPILFFLHGGPGCSQTGAQRKFNSELEEHFIVVNWDQRGSGTSYNPAISSDTMNIEQLLSDAYEVVQYITKKFNQKKVFLMGQSVGAALGLLFIKKYPDVVEAFIGVNQPVNRMQEEIKSYQFTFETAVKKNHKKAIEDLKRIGFPEHGVYKDVNDMVTQRTWLTKFNGVTYKMNANMVNIQYLLSSHLTLKEKLTFMKGLSFTATNMWNELTSLNFFELVPEVEVPIYMVAGRHDRIVALEETEEYFKYVKAPFKELYIFEESGHYALFEEKDKFNELMIHQVLPNHNQLEYKIV